MSCSRLVLFRWSASSAIRLTQRPGKQWVKVFQGQRFFSDKAQGSKDEINMPEHLKNVEFEEEVDRNTIKLDRGKYTEEIKVRMPDMGEGEGKIVKWYKKEGDVVLRADVLCDIETPDFTFGMETDDEEMAVMGQILVDAPSEPIKDNEVICTLLHKEKKKGGTSKESKEEEKEESA